MNENLTNFLSKWPKNLNFNLISAELGDFDSGRHSSGYVSEFRFLATQTEETEAEIEAVHASMSGTAWPDLAKFIGSWQLGSHHW